MTKRKTTTGKRGVKKLKLKKETLRDLDTRGKGREVKGGLRAATYTCYDLCTITCRSCVIAC